MNKFIHKELYNLSVGKLLGRGHSRTVYAHRQCPDLVVKVEPGGQSFFNALEWNFWYEFKGGNLAKWLAPCVDISPCGAVLLMKRADPITAKQLPDRVPAALTDLKLENWGIYQGKPVCVDYGYLINEVSLRLKKAKWS